jgi:hypothetical protein
MDKKGLHLCLLLLGDAFGDPLSFHMQSIPSIHTLLVAHAPFRVDILAWRGRV